MKMRGRPPLPLDLGDALDAEAGGDVVVSSPNGWRRLMYCSRLKPKRASLTSELENIFV